MASPRQPVIGKVWGWPWNWPFRADRPGLRGYFLLLPCWSKPSGNNQETERGRITLSNTVETSLLRRLSTLPDRCRTDLYLENSLEPLKRSWDSPALGLPCWWWHGSGAVGANVRTTEENTSIQDHLTTPPQIFLMLKISEDNKGKFQKIFFFPK